MSLSLSLTLRDIGSGGFSAESEVRFPVGARHLFRFTVATGAEVIIEAAVAHCQPCGDTTYVTGFRFVHSRLTDTTLDIKTLLEATSGEPADDELRPVLPVRT